MKPAVRRTAPLALLLAGLALAGCGPQQAGSAAIVGSDRIATTTLNAEYRTALSYPVSAQKVEQDPVAATRTFLSALIQRTLIDQASAAAHVSVSDANVQSFLQKLYAANGGQQAFEQAFAQQSGFAPAQVPDLARDNLLVSAIGQAKTGPLTSADAETQYQQAGSQALAELSRKEGVQVAPRYGTWDAANGAIVDAPLPSFLVTPGPAGSTSSGSSSATSSSPAPVASPSETAPAASPSDTSSPAASLPAAPSPSPSPSPSAG